MAAGLLSRATMEAASFIASRLHSHSPLLLGKEGSARPTLSCTPPNYSTALMPWLIGLEYNLLTYRPKTFATYHSSPVFRNSSLITHHSSLSERFPCKLPAPSSPAPMP